MRQDIYEMFIQYSAEFQYSWNKIISEGFDSFADKLSHTAQTYKLNQSIEDNRVIWKDVTGTIEAMFVYIIEPTDLDSILSMYQDIKTMNIPVTYAIIEQREDGAGQYDIFRLSERSYLEHANRAYVRGTSCDE